MRVHLDLGKSEITLADVTDVNVDPFRMQKFAEIYAGVEPPAHLQPVLDAIEQMMEHMFGDTDC